MHNRVTVNGMVKIKAELGRWPAQTDKRVHETSRLMPLRYKAELSRWSAQTTDKRVYETSRLMRLRCKAEFAWLAQRIMWGRR